MSSRTEESTYNVRIPYPVTSLTHQAYGLLPFTVVQAGAGSCLAAHLSSYPGLSGCPGRFVIGVLGLLQLLLYDLLTIYGLRFSLMFKSAVVLGVVLACGLVVAVNHVSDHV